MELEQLLQLLQAYGVTSFKNKEYDLELVSFDRSQVVAHDDDFDEGDFQVMTEELKILDNN